MGVGRLLRRGGGVGVDFGGDSGMVERVCGGSRRFWSCGGVDAGWALGSRLRCGVLSGLVFGI